MDQFTHTMEATTITRAKTEVIDKSGRRVERLGVAITYHVERGTTATGLLPGDQVFMDGRLYYEHPDPLAPLAPLGLNDKALQFAHGLATDGIEHEWGWYVEQVPALVAEIQRLRAGLRAICVAGHGDPYATEYVEAGGGYEGLQAIARAALSEH